MYSFQELYKAYIKCRKRKRNTINALYFEYNSIENLKNLETSLNAKTYTPKRSVCFLTSSPKLREVFAATHKTLFKIAKDKGLPIGNLTSQFFANVYMNDFDNYVKRVLKCRYYLRYVDDFVVFANTKEELLCYYKYIKSYLIQNLKLNLRDKYILKQNNQGLDFLGYILRPYYTLSRKRVVNNYKYKKAKFLEYYEKNQGKIEKDDIDKFLSVQASFLGHIKHSNSYNLKKQIGEIDEKKYIKYFNTVWSS